MDKTKHRKSMLYTNDGTGTFTESTLADVDTPIKEVFSVGNVLAIAHGTDDKFTLKNRAQRQVVLAHTC